MSLSFFAIYTNTQAVMQASLRETSAGATRTWSPELDISRVCEARKDLSERNESHTCLLAYPKGEHAKAGEEFRTQPKVLKYIVNSFLPPVNACIDLSLVTNIALCLIQSSIILSSLVSSFGMSSIFLSSSCFLQHTRDI